MIRPDQRFETLQAGRALAALAVVAHHVDLAAQGFKGAALPLLGYGYLGVDFFFVLSGFIIFHSAGGKSVPDFLWHRVRRVVIPYLPIGIGIALLYVILPAMSAGDHRWSWLTTLTLLPLSPGPALSVAWTLQHEMLFYAIFAIAYFRGRLFEALVAWSIAIAVAAAMGVTTIALSPLNLEFAMGIAAAFACRARHPAVLALAGVVPIALWFALGAERQYSILIGLGLACQIPLLLRLESSGRLTASRPMRFLGGASYSVYLAHGLGISVAARAATDLPMSMFALACAAGGVGAGLIYYVLVERPLLGLMPKSLPLKPTLAVD